jgi:phage terminase large subunit-like protein
MLRMAAQRLPFSMSRYSSHFHEVADRLGAGRRDHADLVWLRAMRCSLRDGQGGDQETRAAPLVALALAGAARPVLVFRAMVPPPRDEPMRLPRR